MRRQSSSLADLVNKLPDPDEKGMLTKIDKEVVDNVISEIHEGGRRSIRALIDMLVEPGKGNDVKPRYALHCLAVYVCKLNDDGQRRAFAKALASQLGGDRPKAVQGYLVRQLQVAGGQEVAAVLGKLLHDQELCEYAAQALVAIGDGAAEQLRNALPKAEGKCRLTIMQNLGVVRDSRSVRSLEKGINDEDREVRLAAAWALANIGDTGAVGVLLRAADAESAYERIKATQACLVLAERLLATGEKDEAVRIYSHLRETRTEPAEQYVRDAAEKGLAATGKR
jgi:HEAT repeat protein